MIYIATFYSHFGAIRYKKLCEGAGIKARIMPVPRDLSSSCGTCVSCEGTLLLPEGSAAEEVEQIVEAVPGGYNPVYRAEDS